MYPITSQLISPEYLIDRISVNLKTNRPILFLTSEILTELAVDIILFIEISINDILLQISYIKTISEKKYFFVNKPS